MSLKVDDYRLELRWERRQYGSPEARQVMESYMRRMKEQDHKAGKRAAETLRRKRRLSQ
jgi:hypothetical protein